MNYTITSERAFWRMLASHDARLWEKIDPHVGPWNRVALNPQPLPPKELGEALMIAVFTRSAASGHERFAEILDDWCGTGWPGKFPPRPKGYEFDPQVLLGAAFAAADLAMAVDDADLAGMLGKGARQLFETAIEGVG
ncbi:hypothetical protein ACQB6R_09160 [Propionibacteriaceae bacterium G1746]